MTDAERDDAGGYGHSGSESSGGKSAGTGGGPVKGAGSGGGIKLPRHEFVSKLVKDPANLSADERMVMLTGWAGDSDEEGYTRLYCEPTLDCYGDVKDEDLLHYEEDPEVGYRVWARAGAQVKYGRRGESKSEAAKFLGGDLLTDYRGGAQAGGQQGGAQPGAQVGAQIGQTGWHYCSILTCPPTQPHITIIGHTAWHFCSAVCPTQPVICGVLPPSFGCPPQQGGQAQALAAAPAGGAQNTAATLCTQIGCDPTAATHCFICPPRTVDCPLSAAEAAAPGGAQNTTFTVCTQIGCGHDQVTIINPTLATRCFICPPITYNCPPQGTVAGPHTVAPGCTLGFTCTAIACPPHTGFVCPPPGTAATVCTQFHCPPHTGFICPPHGTVAGPHTYGPGCTLGFTCTYVGCPR